MDLDMVNGVTFQSENDVETTPNTLEIFPEYNTDEFLLEKVAHVITKVLRRIYPHYTIKASIEPQIHYPTDEDNNITGTRPIKHLPKISIRWNSNRWGTEPSDVKIEGESITPEEDEIIEDPQEAVNKLAAIETIYNSDKDPDQTTTDENAQEQADDTDDDDIVDLK